ncbi:MAG TPA: helix-turn-helix transcriptional regulator [Cellvibrio sp.]|nr:helix-turn-helix transcriptional regulator [Cellvibrio sp.]
MLIKELRQKRLLSQEQLAELCGLSLRTIQRVESGHRIGFASLRALAAEFNVSVESLEQELYAMEKVSNEFKELPLWLRLYIGSGWFSANRDEFKKIELFYLILSLCFLAFWVSNSILNFLPEPTEKVLIIGGFCTLAGAYNASATIRTADRYDVWSRLEATLPKRPFWAWWKNNKHNDTTK